MSNFDNFSDHLQILKMSGLAPELPFNQEGSEHLTSFGEK